VVGSAPRAQLKALDGIPNRFAAHRFLPLTM
jgi:hypothetical protein